MSPSAQDSSELDDFDRIVAALNKHRVDFISREDLISIKRAVARPKDLLDVVELEADRAGLHA